jgi:hypothetical protein
MGLCASIDAEDEAMLSFLDKKGFLLFPFDLCQRKSKLHQHIC